MHGGRYASIVDAIGHTPLVEIPRMCPNPNVLQVDQVLVIPDDEFACPTDELATQGP